MAISVKMIMHGYPVSSPRGALGWCNVVLIQSNGRNILFDTGSYGDRSLLLEELKKLGIEPPGGVHAIFFSHFHFDHVVNAELFPTAKLFLSANELQYIAGGHYREAGDPYVPIAHIDYFRERLQPVDEGEIIAEGVQTLYLPGHTPGQMGLLLAQKRMLLAGDGIKNGWEFVRSEPPPSFHSPSASLESYQKARESAKIIVPGHDRPFELLEGGGIRYLENYSTEIRVFADPLGDPKLVDIAAKI